MVWTDSQDYGAYEILYIARTALFNKTNQLICEIIILFIFYLPVVPQLTCPQFINNEHCLWYNKLSCIKLK